MRRNVISHVFMFALATVFTLSAVDAARAMCCMDLAQEKTDAPPCHKHAAAHDQQGDSQPDAPKKP